MNKFINAIKYFLGIGNTSTKDVPLKPLGIELETKLDELDPKTHRDMAEVERVGCELYDSKGEWLRKLDEEKSAKN